MATSFTSFPTPVGPTAQARVALTPGTARTGLLDGAWWPRSRDLAAELPLLLDALEGTWGRITRVLVNPVRWPVVPRKVPVPGRVVHVGWFTELGPDKVILRSYTVGRYDLLVVPPETEPAAAARLMSAASAPGGLRTAGDLMADEAEAAGTDGDEPRQDERGRADWDTDGGAAQALVPPPRQSPVVGARMIPLRKTRWGW
ncbi:DUF5994 family protein [Streptomyces sp. Da 82-17]|uniref:DUF5994 family protein n=1 Tax=Streptomyces sp. Da 82-17 TaxID=3377116 RepID=UPI0038D40126